MIDIAIFGFGLAVFLLVGSALVTLITVNNRELERSVRADTTASEPRAKTS